MAPVRRVPAVVAATGLLLAACTAGGSPGAAPGPSVPGSTTVTSTTTGPPPSVPPPATVAGCPPVPDRARPDPTRPRYRLTVEVRPAEAEVLGTLAVDFAPDLATDRLVFRLWPNGPRLARAGAGLAVADLRWEGRDLPIEQPDPTTLVVRPPGGLAPGVETTTSLSWRLGLPSPGADDRVGLEGGAVRLGSFFPILAWEPGRGWATEPPVEGFAEASTAPVADFSVDVTVPPGADVLATGQRHGWRWEAPAVRDFALSVGRFRQAERTARAPGPVAVTVGVQEGLGDDPAAYADKVVAALEDFARRFGPYPWPTLTLAVTPGLMGGIEYPAHLLQGPRTQGRTTAHEVAHMWFYGLVGNDQGADPWLDEGLATYAEATFEGVLAQVAATPLPAAARGRLGEPMTYWSAQGSAYYRGVYVQGAQALAALGPPELVDCALAVYAAVGAHGIAEPADLVAAARAVFPEAAAVLAGYGVDGGP